ncbi:hypothetical protein HFP72_04290 [Nocardiopsis sp. ARC36]
MSGRGIARHWYFSTPQRIGSGDDRISLLDATRTALSRDRLADAVEGRGMVYDRARDYRRAVDEALFGLGEQRYGALVDLLVQLRQPQLSKRPSETALSRALTESLPPVDQAVIADVAEAYRELEDDETELNAMADAERAASAFLGHYRDYARAAARRAARPPRTEHSATRGSPPTATRPRPPAPAPRPHWWTWRPAPATWPNGSPACTARTRPCGAVPRWTAHATWTGPAQRPSGPPPAPHRPRATQPAPGRTRPVPSTATTRPGGASTTRPRIWAPSARRPPEPPHGRAWKPTTATASTHRWTPGGSTATNTRRLFRSPVTAREPGSPLPRRPAPTTPSGRTAGRPGRGRPPKPSSGAGPAPSTTPRT